MDHSKILLAVIAAVITSCADFRESEAIPAGLSLNVEDLFFPEEGSTETLTVRSGRKWSVMEEKPDWITIESIGSHSAYMYEWPITLNAESNAGYDRDDSLFFKAGEETKKLFVYQRGVKGAYVALESVSISPRTLTLVKGEKEKMSVVLYPSSASEQSVVWSSSNTSVATVSPEGVVTASEVGTSTITVKANDGGKTATCLVTVIAERVSVTGITLDKTYISMAVGETEHLTATVFPSDATDKTVTWSSYDSSVATVSSTGEVTAKSVGVAKIVVFTHDGGESATCIVSVSAAKVSVTGVSFNEGDRFLELIEGDSQLLRVTVTPSDATDQSLSWSSSSTSVATVSSTGVVKAVSEGEATITVTTNDGGMTDECTVSVIPEMKSIRFRPQVMFDGVGGAEIPVFSYFPLSLANEDTPDEIAYEKNDSLLVSESIVLEFDYYPANANWSFLRESSPFLVKWLNRDQYQIMHDYKVTDLWQYENGRLFMRVSYTGTSFRNESNLSLCIKRRDGSNIFSDVFVIKQVEVGPIRIACPKVGAMKKGIQNADEHYRRATEGITNPDREAYNSHAVYETATDLSGMKSVCDTMMIWSESLDLKGVVSAHLLDDWGKCREEMSEPWLESLGLGWKFEVVENYELGDPVVDQADCIGLRNGILTSRLSQKEVVGKTPIIRVILWDRNNSNAVQIAYVKVFIAW